MSTSHTFRTVAAFKDISKLSTDSEYDEEFAISTMDELIAAAARIEKEYMIVWFQGSNAVAIMNAGETELIKLVKDLDISYLGTASEANDGQINPTHVSFLFPISAVNLDWPELSKIKPIKITIFKESISIPKLKGIFNSLVAWNPELCLILLRKQAGSNPIIVDRLTWQTGCMADGTPLNSTTDVWQFSCYISNNLVKLQPAILEIINRPIGSFVSKSDAASIFSTAVVTRYFQREPSAVELTGFLAKHKLTGISTCVFMHRKAGLIAYSKLEPKFELDL